MRGDTQLEAGLIEQGAERILARWQARVPESSACGPVDPQLDAARVTFAEPILACLVAALRGRERDPAALREVVAGMSSHGCSVDVWYSRVLSLRETIFDELLEHGFSSAPTSEAARYLTRVLHESYDRLIVAALAEFHREIERQRRERDEYYAIIDHHVLVTKTDERGRITFASEAFAAASGWRREELVGRDFSVIRHPDVPAALFGDLWRSLREGHGWWGEIKNRRRDGEAFWIQVAVTPIRAANGELQGYMAVGHDVTAHYAAVTDSLTGVFNRHKLDEELAREHERSLHGGAPYSLVIVDLDHFKRVNDTLGHQAGDHALRDLARVVRGELRSVDVFARWGGEEFVALMPRTNVHEAARVAERLREAVSQHDFSIGLRLTISCGVAQLAPGEEAEQVLRRADVNLYAAKNSGRNRVVASAASQ